MSPISSNEPTKSTVHFLSPNAQLVVLLGVGIALRLIWLAYTNYTYEDAFITFRYARNIAAGNGFVYNIDERIYGTTTPLFTLWLAVWLIPFPESVVLGARVLDLLAALGALALTWSLLSYLEIRNVSRCFVLMLLVFSNKLWERDTGGMETPLVIFLMVAALYAIVRSRSVIAGILAGLLLWTRIDTVVWVAVLVFMAWYINHQLSLRLVLIAGLIYLPWLVFATIYFGSPIPHTIVAKWVAYYLNGSQVSLLDRLKTVLEWLTPITIPPEWGNGRLSIALVTVMLAVWGALEVRRSKALIILAAFGVLELVRLTLTGATFEPRYFVSLYWVTLVLAGLGLGTIARRFSATSFDIRVIVGILLVSGVIGFWLIVQQARIIRDYQFYVYDSSLKPLGLWLNQHAPPTATVLLEPLGYAGYYADRHMIDEVGVVSPQIVELKRQGVNDMLSVLLPLRPDYVVFHCDDILYRLQRSDSTASEFSLHYQHAATFNPLNFNPLSSKPQNLSEYRLQRNACYEIWEIQN